MPRKKDPNKIDGREIYRPQVWRFLPEAYAKASGDGQLPASPRQIWYQIRALILAEGLDCPDFGYFSQKMLDKYIATHPEAANWDIVYDDRGDLYEPHTGVVIPLGTMSIRNYIRDSSPAQPLPVVELANRDTWHTYGPEDRFKAALFVEKEGFHPLIRRSRSLDKHDLALMSSKGYSVAAARRFLDEMHEHIDIIITVHDFDIYGFTIAGSLGKTTTRYQYANGDEVFIYDIGLRLKDAQEMELQSEPFELRMPKQKDEDSELVEESEGGKRVPPYELPPESWAKYTRTLRAYGATEEEIEFFHSGQRIELNAMSAPQFVAWLDGKLTELAERGLISKVIPDEDTLTEHAENILRVRRAQKWLDKMPPYEPTTPFDLVDTVEQELYQNPHKPWDEAVEYVLQNYDDDDYDEAGFEDDDDYFSEGGDREGDDSRQPDHLPPVSVRRRLSPPKDDSRQPDHLPPIVLPRRRQPSPPPIVLPPRRRRS